MGFKTEAEAKNFLEDTKSPSSRMSSPRVFPTSPTSTPLFEDRHGIVETIGSPSPPTAAIPATMCEHSKKDLPGAQRHPVSPDRSATLAGIKRQASVLLEPSSTRISRFGPDLAPPRLEPTVHETANLCSTFASDTDISPSKSRWRPRVSRWGTVASISAPVLVSAGTIAEPQAPHHKAAHEDRPDSTSHAVVGE